MEEEEEAAGGRGVVPGGGRGTPRVPLTASVPSVVSLCGRGHEETPNPHAVGEGRPRR